jgi:hypothetical protein
MFEEENIVKVYRVTVKKIIERLLQLQNIAIEEFQSEVLEQFDGYDYKDIEEVVGFENWPDISENGSYELNVKINHEDAYEFTLHVQTADKKISIYNVL